MVIGNDQGLTQALTSVLKQYESPTNELNLSQP
jgi:hypothetical protein